MLQFPNNIDLYVGHLIAMGLVVSTPRPKETKALRDPNNVIAIFQVTNQLLLSSFGHLFCNLCIFELLKEEWGW